MASLSSNVTIVVRKAKKEDMNEVFQMIKELAVFEKLEDQVKINESVLEQDGFESSPAFSCLVAQTSDNKLCGYALYYTAYSTWLGKSTFLEDLYVRPTHRKQGVGRKLFMAVAKLAYEMPSKRLDFHVLSWNPAIDFYKSLGAMDLTEIEKWKLFRLNEEALSKMFS